ncbi:adenosylmethionine--8-amino-7-oxononanoate transaminase [Magnetofaba australis]|uniref:Adenosylmethionine-8-amino-7-oxononanoate aminotransferase n=1 Tax=Magnetofaba australis IT-1 TaxID=1434232 RepID=A0A1Y2K121_9PROT|nr:adenosylmethionine--8-amino-7-oxononanoate transaminase [Magnetofaba australis]OSM00453.1 putative adenosylmethionine-8-amino-7-oxononanoate aminotransferase [Magnetofaba australis IT-1]
MHTPRDLIDSDRRCLWHPYTQEKTAPDPIPIASARDATLTTVDGREILDLISSWWVTAHGHGHPVIAEAIAQQARTLEQVIFAGFTHQPAVDLAQQLGAALGHGLTRVFFSDDGSTAVEVALKMALHAHQNQGQPRPRLLAFEGGYHGDTWGAMSVGGSSGYFEPYLRNGLDVAFIPYPHTWMGDPFVEEKEALSLLQLEEILLHNAQTPFAACVIEPLIQGAGGMRVCRPEFLQRLAKRLKEAGILLIFDEVMTGFGRTGSLFAFQQCGVTPDIICLSKGLTGGFLPLSATVCQQSLYEAFLGDSFNQALAHGHSFTANPIGCAAAVASLQLFEQENTLSKVSDISSLHQSRMRRYATGKRPHPIAQRPRVVGSMAALDIVAEDAGYQAEIGDRMKRFFREKDLLIRPLGNTLYLLPPYCVTPEQLHRGWDAIDELIEQLEAERRATNASEA